MTPARPGEPERIVRFDATERAWHWAQAIPWLALLGTGAAMLLSTPGGPFPDGERRADAAWAHRAAAIVLGAAIFVVLLAGRRRSLLENLRIALTWRRADLRWLVAWPLHELGLRVRVPAVGKFNPGQKLNLLAVVALLPVFALSGAVMWLVHGALLAWYVHVAAFAVSAPLLAGHLYLALLHPGTRRGLRGVLDGRVRRDWAEEHYPDWARDRPCAPSGEAPAPPCRRPARARTAGADM